LRGQKTVLVLGAGASKGFGLPLGQELRDTIARDLNIMFDGVGRNLRSGSWEIVEALKLLVRQQKEPTGNINPHRAAAVKISNAMPLSGSIDEYIERHKDDVLKAECAKLAIAKAILEAERKSTIFVDHTLRIDNPLRNSSDSWIAYFLRDITRGKTLAELESCFDNVSIVNFNYDRCVEHFAYYWFQQMYDITPAKASEIVSRLRVFHPYGKLADLPHENPNSHIAFGGEIDAHRLLQMSSSIKTYSESIESGFEISSVQHNLSVAPKVVFMGFGFHSQNLSLLSVPKEKARASATCYVTTAGISRARWELCKAEIAQQFNLLASNGLFCFEKDGTCEEFWREYGDVIVQ
jgi:hypothetical protein